MASEVTIRSATLSDVPQVARIHVDTWRTTYPGLIDQAYLDALSYESKARQWSRGIELKSPHSRRFVAEVDGVVCGFVIVGRKAVDEWKPTAELFAMYVLDSMQSKGIGSALYDAGATWLKSAGNASMVIRVLKGNAKTIRFYESKGAVFVGEEGVELGSRSYEHLVYECDLTKF